MSTTTETASRPPRAHRASVALTALAVVCAFLLAPVSTAAAAEPLPSGVYELSIRSGEVRIEVADDDSVALSATDGLVVQLRFDELGRVLDEFTVATDTTSYLVELELDQDAAYDVAIEQQLGPDADRDVGEVVSTVARCAPTGVVAQAMGLPNHGTIVSTAASGLTLDVQVTDPVTGDVSPILADFSSLVGAQEFCADVDAAVPTLDDVRTALETQAAQARAELASAQQDRAAAQEARGRAIAAERAAERIAERARQEAAARAAAARRVPGRPDGATGSDRAAQGGTDRADQGGTGRSGGADEDTDGTSRDEEADESADSGSGNGVTGSDTDGTSTDDGSDGDGSDTSDDGGSDDAGPDTSGDTSTTEDTSSTGADGDTTDDSTGDDTAENTTPGQGQGRPDVPGSNGKGPKR